MARVDVVVAGSPGYSNDPGRTELIGLLLTVSRVRATGQYIFDRNVRPSAIKGNSGTERRTESCNINQHLLPPPVRKSFCDRHKHDAKEKETLFSNLVLLFFLWPNHQINYLYLWMRRPRVFFTLQNGRQIRSLSHSKFRGVFSQRLIDTYCNSENGKQLVKLQMTHIGYPGYDGRLLLVKTGPETGQAKWWCRSIERIEGSDLLLDDIYRLSGWSRQTR